MTAPPVLEPRRADALLQALEARLPAYVPGWKPAPGGAGTAVLSVYAQFLEALAERINAAPEKAALALLDALAVDVLAAQPARAPVVFRTIPRGGDSRAPAGTRLGAKGRDPTTPIVFETERTVGLAQARLAEVVSVLPARDSYADHTSDALGGRPFTLWDPLERVRHELYLAHDLHFALAGRASVSLDLELAQGGQAPLALEWEWWDGEQWRAFKDTTPTLQDGFSFDGTTGLTRSGKIVLGTDCAASKRRMIGGWNAHWLRARSTRPLPPDAARTFAHVDRIGIRTSLARSVGSTCSGGLLPDAAFADGQTVDFSKPAQPLGARPDPGSALYLSCGEAFSRPGATVTICVRKASTPEDEADAKSRRYELDVTKAKQLLEAARRAANLTKQALDGLAATELRTDNLPNLWDAGEPNAWYSGVRNKLIDAREAILDAIPDMITTIQLVGAKELPGVGVIAGLAGNATTKLPLDRLVEALKFLSANPSSFNAEAGLLSTRADAFIDDITAPHDAINAAQHGPQLTTDGTNLVVKARLDSALLPLNRPAIFANAQRHFDEVKKRVTDAKTALGTALTQIQIVIDNLTLLSPMSAAAASGFLPPTLATPSLTWEYWNGGAWRPLVVTPTGDASSFRGSGSFTFSVPDDWTSSVVNGVEGLWARARLKSGSYATLRLVSWTDQESQAINFLPIIEPRPPVLETLRVGYDWTSKPASPQRCLTLNDFRWEDHTEDAAWRGGSFEPFRNVEDQTPALYLGFDGPLPADLLGMLVDLEEDEPEDAPPLVWEHWDGAGWSEVSVEDETSDLAVPGVVHMLHPGDDQPALAQVTVAAGNEIRLVDSRAATGFAPGQQVWLSSGDQGELVRVAGVSGPLVEAEAPLGREYGAASLQRWGLARFGVPRSWLRARLRTDGEPRRARVRGIHPNASWAAQVETIEDELLGSSNGEPRQTFFFRRPPVLAGELVEVCELEGRRAHVEYPLLVESLARQGIAENDLRRERDAAGEITEVWVPWQWKPTLAFSGANDRHYTLERTRGRLVFGDARRGAIPPAGPDNVRSRRYRSGGGEAGNGAAGAVDQVLAGLLVQGATNPRAAEGGADSESVSRVLERGSLMLGHRRQAVTRADAEAVARESSPEVAVARAICRERRLTLAIVPHSRHPRPTPSYLLRRHVRDFLRSRVPASLAGAVEVVPPAYLPVDVAATLAPRDPSRAGEVAAAARFALAEFLHPLTGGPAGTGWPFGRGVHVSDVAALLERLGGVDYVRSLTLLVGGAPHGDHVDVADDRLVCAGTLDVELGEDA